MDDHFLELHDYRASAVAGAQRASVALAKMGVRAVITGSLARGGFGPHSDVDLLVLECPRELKYAIEGVVEDELQGIPFDLVYLDELPEWKKHCFTQGAVDAADLG